MRINPVRSKAVPRYPTSGYLEQHPELLEIVPERWRQNAFVLKILGGVACLLLASQTASAQQPVAPPPSRIAPLFLHGTGRGAFGCVTVNPPVFLSEDEARQVIQQELRKMGFELAPGAFTVPDASVPVTDPYWCLSQDGKEIVPERIETSKRSLTLDGFDQKHRVAYTFVSHKDYWAWQTEKPRCWSSVSSIDTKAAAAILREGLPRSAAQPWIGLFYEPYASMPRGCMPSYRLSKAEREAAWDRCVRGGKESDKEQLRKQVVDFIHWLKAQGVI